MPFLKGAYHFSTILYILTKFADFVHDCIVEIVTSFEDCLFVVLIWVYSHPGQPEKYVQPRLEFHL